MSVSIITAAMLLASAQVGAPVGADAPPVVPEGASLKALIEASIAMPPPPVPVPAAPAAAAADAAAVPGEIVVTARRDAPPEDPLQAVNAQAFEATQAVDEAVLRPVAIAYKRTLPGPIRSGVRNFLGNLAEPVAALNFLLQLKPGKAAETLGRFAVNTTIGAVGLFDVAKKKPFKLPRRSNGFANSLGYYGVKQGPYLVLPLLGATTLRDLLGNFVDSLVLPVGVGGPFAKVAYTAPSGVLAVLDRRAELDESLEDMRAKSGDFYVAYREFYLQRREAEIAALRGKRPASDPAVPPLVPVPAPK